MKPRCPSPSVYGSLKSNDASVQDPEADTSTELQDPDLRCGYGSWKPSCLQKCNNSKCLLAVMCWFVFVQSFVVSGIVNVNTATLERRFDLSSSQVAWISSSYDLCGAVLSFVVGYLATFANKPRMMTISASIMAAGSFIMYLPHIIVEPYSLGNKVMDVCQEEVNMTDSCAVETRSSDLSRFVYVLITGQLLHGVGGVAAYIIGTTVVDESTDSQNSPVYIGIMHGTAALGPAVGFLFGGVMLHYYVDFDKVDVSTIDVTPTDPRWVGAWWVGFVVSAVAGLTVVLLLACFAEELPETAGHRAVRVSEAYAGRGEKETETVDFGRSWGDFFTSLRIVFGNPTWVLMTLAAVLEAGIIQAFATFMPKVLQFQFALSPGNAAVVSGALIVPAAAIGQVLGGLIPKWGRLKVKGLTIQCVVGCGITLALSFTFVFRCDMPKIAGITEQYWNSEVMFSSQRPISLRHPCNEHCDCNEKSYEPVCGVDGLQYFSPCHAGCQSKYVQQGVGTIYYNCSCISLVRTESSTVPSISLNKTDIIAQSAKEGTCSQDCDAVMLFLPFLFLMTMGTFTANTAFFSTTMRVVPAKQRAFACGLQGTLIRFLGATPFPLLFGLMFDQVCYIWQETCDDGGSCWIYDNELLGKHLMYLILAVKSISTSCFFAAFLVYRPPKSANSEQSEVDGQFPVRAEPSGGGSGGGGGDPNCTTTGINMGASFGLLQSEKNASPLPNRIQTDHVDKRDVSNEFQSRDQTIEPRRGSGYRKSSQNDDESGL